MHFCFSVEVLLLLIIFLVGCAAADAGACAAYNISTEAERGTGYCFCLLRFCRLHCDASDVYCFCSWLLVFLSSWLRHSGLVVDCAAVETGCMLEKHKMVAHLQCYNKMGYFEVYTYLVRIHNFLFHFPFDEMYRRLHFFTLGRSIPAWIDYTTKWKPSKTTTPGKATDMMAGICTFPRLPCPCTKRHVMINLTCTRVRNSGTSALYVCNLLLWLTWWWMLLYRPLRKVTSTNTRKKHVRCDSNMCRCCCCRFCCGAPTTDERIHAPVLHDASHIACCRYWGRASSPPTTSIGIDWDVSGGRFMCIFVYHDIPMVD